MRFVINQNMKNIFQDRKRETIKAPLQFVEAIYKRMKNSRKFKYLNDLIKGFIYKEIALRFITIPLDASDQVKRVFLLLGLLMFANINIYILSEFNSLLN